MIDNKEASTDLALIDANDLSLVEGNNLNASQLAMILKKTPQQYVHKRPAKGGGTWDYVTGGYIKKCLNLMFGWDWDFEIFDEKILFGEVIVKGKLTCRSNGNTIVKMQFGNKDIVYKKQTAEEISKGLEKIPLSIGNDLKSASTDCLKKCASEIGISADIYNKEDFKEVKVGTEKDFETIHDEIVYLFEEKKEQIPAKDFPNIQRIIDNKEKTSYSKVLKLLKSL
jgi:Rad52/22 family double-strand break repair protein